MPSVLTIDFVSDLVSPWCFIGRRRLAQALQSVQGTAEPKLRWAPFELHPAIPKQGIRLDDYLKTVFGDPGAGRRFMAELAESGEREGIRFHFDRVKSVPNTLDAHRLVLLAEEQGRQPVVVDQLFRGFFEEGMDIGDPGVLAEVAEEAGLNGDAVRAYLAGPDGTDEVRSRASAARAAGLTGVPAFIFNGEVAVLGVQSPDVYLAAVDHALFGESPEAPEPASLH